MVKRKLTEKQRAELDNRTIADDNARRNVLDRMRNYANALGPAPAPAPTQTINPVTGRDYEDFENSKIGISTQIVHLTEEGKRREKLFENSIFKKNFRDSDYFVTHRSPEDLEFFEYQLALARKDVREGKMKGYDYDYSVSLVKEVVENLEDVKLPLSVINTASGLDKAIEGVRKNREQIFWGNFVKYDKVSAKDHQEKFIDEIRFDNYLPNKKYI
jgi:hypothetical protein